MGYTHYNTSLEHHVPLYGPFLLWSTNCQGHNFYGFHRLVPGVNILCSALVKSVGYNEETQLKEIKTKKLFHSLHSDKFNLHI